MGGLVLHEGKIAEMKTGEGKTIVALLPTFLNALDEKGTHVVTVNDYLAQRDSDYVGQVHRFLGLTVGLIQENMEDSQLGELTNELLAAYKDDLESRAEWLESYTDGLDLLGTSTDERSEPFRGASGVYHPLLAESATQFQSQAYKELLPPSGPVQTRLIGETSKEVEAQAQRVKDYMNFMVLDVMEEFDPELDQMLYYLPLSGSTFKKIYYDAMLDRPVSKFIPAEDLVVPYYASDLKDCERITHVIKMSENDLLKKMTTGFYRNVEITPTQAEDNEIQDKYEKIVIDNVAIGHETGKYTKRKNSDFVIPATMWTHTKEWEVTWGQQKKERDARWVGPETTSFPSRKYYI